MSTNFESPAAAAAVQAQPVEAVEGSRFHEIVYASKRLAANTTVALGLATGLVAGEAVVVTPPAAVAETGGYPDATAPCVVGNPADPNSSSIRSPELDTGATNTVGDTSPVTVRGR